MSMSFNIEATPFSFQPPAGGDVTLKSSDNVVFLVHSTSLGLASSVFANMFSTATQKDTVELSEDTESVSLMLRFIYPPPFLNDQLSLTMIEKSLHMAKKYDIEGIRVTLDNLLSHLPNGKRLLQASPAHFLYLATSYDLPETRKAAAKAIGHWDLQRSADIKDMARKFPDSAPIVGVLGAYRVRTIALFDLLVDMELSDVAPEYDVSRPKPMMCASCFKNQGHPVPSSFSEHYPYHPPWLYAWCLQTFKDLMEHPLEECDHNFRLSSLDRLDELPKGCEECLNAARLAGGGRDFGNWAWEAKTKVQKIFHDIEPLYSL